MTVRFRSSLRLIAGFAVSLVCMFLALRGINLSDVGSMLATTRPVYLLPAMGVLILAFIIRAIRWGVLLKPVKSVPISTLFASTMIGFMANNVLPFRAGEIVRAYSISQNENINISSSLASLVVERLFDGIAISLFMISLLWFVSMPAWLVKFNYVLVFVYILIACAAVILIWVMKGNQTRSESKWHGMMRNFTAGLEVFAKRKQLAWSSFLSFGHWLLVAMYYYFLFLACGFALSFYAAVVLVAIVGIGIMLPAAPGFVGNFQYFTVLALSLFSISREDAFGYSLIAHAGQFIPVTAIGLLYFFRQSAGFAELRNPERQPA